MFPDELSAVSYLMCVSLYFCGENFLIFFLGGGGETHLEFLLSGTTGSCAAGSSVLASAFLRLGPNELFGGS